MEVSQEKWKRVLVIVTRQGFIYYFILPVQIEVVSLNASGTRMKLWEKNRQSADIIQDTIQYICVWHENEVELLLFYHVCFLKYFLIAYLFISLAT